MKIVRISTLFPPRIILPIILFFLLAYQAIGQAASISTDTDRDGRTLNASIHRLLLLIGEGEHLLSPAEIVASVRLLRQTMRGEALNNEEKKWKRLILRLSNREISVIAYRQALSEIRFTGLLEVNSLPDGATIFLDGEETEFVTPHTFHLSTGNHRVKLKQSTEYEPSVEKIAPVQLNRIPRIHFTLTPLGHGTLLVSSRPFGATIYLDGKQVGDTPLKLTNLRAGQHQLRLVTGEAEYAQTFEIQRDQTTKIIKEFRPQEIDN